MSQAQEEAVVRWLAKHEVHCPICHGIDFTWFKDFIRQSKVETGASIIRFDTDFVGYTCSRCGYFWMTEARVAGVPRQ